jgi:hypothetical protein
VAVAKMYMEEESLKNAYNTALKDAEDPVR